MTTPTFPELGTKIVQGSLRETPDNPAIVARTEGGYEFSRPRSTRRPRITYSFALSNLTDAEKGALLDFWRDVARGGSNAFHWTRPTDGAAVMVRFSGPVEFAYAGPTVQPDGSALHRWHVPSVALKEV